MKRKRHQKVHYVRHLGYPAVAYVEGNNVVIKIATVNKIHARTLLHTMFKSMRVTKPKIYLEGETSGKK